MTDTDTHTKTCKTCGEAKPLTEYSITDKKRGYPFPHCKPCAAAKKRAERAADPEKIRAYQRAQYRKNIDVILPRMRRANLRQYYKIKDEIISALGGQCNRCGWRLSLHIDHVNDDGAAHRREVGGYSYSLRVI